MRGDICDASGRELAALIRARKVSAREVMTAHLARINRFNPTLNAIVAKLDDDRCLALADEADRMLARGDAVGPLHGLPWAFKDLETPSVPQYIRIADLQGPHRRRTLRLSPGCVRRACCPSARRTCRSSGMGSHTYNRVYGTTVNPYDVTMTAGGSSGGAGAALAAGLLPLADGSDLGGSLRNPANFNNIVALRPTSGLAPALSDETSLGLNVKGPMARSVDDVAFLLGVMTGRDVPSLERDLEGVRVAWCPDLGGLPLEARVRDVLNASRSVFEDLGCIVADACPDLTDADEVFLTMRRRRAFANLGSLLWSHRGEMKPEAIEEIERGAVITGSDVIRATGQHERLLARVDKFFSAHDFLVCAVNQVAPFDAILDWPHEIARVPMEHYAAWMKSAYWISTTLCPAASVPAGFVPEGLPVGIQIVGRRGDDAGVLQVAYAFEQATGHSRRKPALPGGTVKTTARNVERKT
jgi:amidase